MQGFSDKSIDVLIAEADDDLADQLIESIKDVGFKNVDRVATCKEALERFGSNDEVPGWFVTSIMAGEDVNALHILEITLKHEKFRNMRMSLFVEEEEKACLVKAFELGLLSFHNKPFNGDSLAETFKELFDLFEEYEWNDCRTSAEIIRKEIVTSKSPADIPQLLELYENLLTVFPAEGELLLRLAEAQFLAEKPDEGKKSIAAARLLNPDLEDQITQVGEDVGGGEDAVSPDNTPPSLALELTTAVIVETDDSVIETVKENLSEFGVEDVEVFNDGEAAWEHLSKCEEPSVILQEWNLPKVTGHTLLQRVRNHGFVGVPIIVLSSQVGPKDVPLLKEMSVSSVIEKPFGKEALASSLVSVLHQEAAPSDKQVIIRQIRQKLASGDVDEAKQLRDKVLEMGISRGDRKHVLADFAYQAGNFDRAKDFATEALQAKGDSLLLLNLLGKCFLKLRDYKHANLCFAHAKEMSPNNIERLCNMAEAKTADGDIEEGQEAVDAASAIDCDDTMVQETQAKVSASAGDTEKAKEIISNLDDMMGIVAFMNNQAVGYAFEGDHDKAIETYQKAIDSAPDDKLNEIAILSYNVSLALIKANRQDEVDKFLKKCLEVEDSPVHEKAVSLKSRVEKAVEKGTQVALRASPKDSAVKISGEDEDGGAVIPEDFVYYTRGGRCCYLLMKITSQLPENVRKLFVNQPKLKAGGSGEEENQSGGEAETAESAS